MEQRRCAVCGLRLSASDSLISRLGQFFHATCHDLRTSRDFGALDGRGCA